MSSRISGNRFGPPILEFLGIDAKVIKVKRFTLEVDVGTVPILTLECFPSVDMDQAESVFTRYEVVERDIEPQA